jgi:hypothetical protein
MRRWTPKPYEDTYTQTQIDEVRDLGTSEKDMLEILIYTQDYKLTVERTLGRPSSQGRRERIVRIVGRSLTLAKRDGTGTGT